MVEAHKTRYAVHPGADKMYHDLRDMYWWLVWRSWQGCTLIHRTTWSACVDYFGSRWTVYITFLANITESLRDTIRYEYGLTSSGGWTNYHSSTRCAPFEALYGRKCRSPVLWAEIRESRLIRPELVQETTDKVVLIKEKLKAARDCQKSYADNRRKPPGFEVRDQVLLKVSPWKGVIRFEKKGKLAPSKILIVEVRWNSKCGPEFTWECEDHMKSKCDLPLCDDSPRSNHLTSSNPLFDSNEDFTSSDNESFSEEVVPMENFKIFSNPLFDLDEEIISTKINPICNEVLESIDLIPPGIDHFNAESDLIESLLNQDSSIISYSKINSLLNEFAGELILLKSIPPGIDEANCDPEEEIHLIEKLLYDNSSPCPPKEIDSENSDATIESFFPSHIPVEDSDSLRDEIDLSLTSDDSMPPSIEDDDYDSERDIRIIEELLSNDSLSLSKNESFHLNIPSSPRPHAKPPDDDEIKPNSKILTVKVVDIYAADSENCPPMLNKENCVSWSSHLLWYAKSRPNGKLIHNSIINGPYVRRMIPEPGDLNREVSMNETFHVQTDDELTEKELKQIEADDQAIQTILLSLPEDIYAAVDSCETAQEILLRVQQMMKGSDIRIQEKKAKLFNEWERFTSTDVESIKSYYHRFLKLMNDFKRNKHFPEKIASNLKFLNNLKPEWSRHVTIVRQKKDMHTADYTQLYDFLKYNQKEVDDLRAERLVKTQDPLALMATSNNPYTFPVLHQDQPSPTFKLNYSTRTNNNQRISSNPRNRQITQLGMNMGQDGQMQMVGGNGGNQFGQYTGQNVGNLNGYNAVNNVKNQNPNGNGNHVAARAEGNATGHNGIQLLAEEFDLMAAVADLDEIEEVNANRILMANLQQASTSGTQTDKAPVYDSDGSVESLYNGKVLLEKHDPPVVHDLEETLQLAQESRLKMKQLNKEIKAANYIKINHLSWVFVPQSAKSREELYFLNTSKMTNVSKPISIPNEEFSDDTTPSVAQKFLNEVKSTIVTLQRVVKHRMTLDTHNWSSSAYQELHKTIKDEILPIVNQVNTRVQNFEIQVLKEAAKFVQDFKSLAKKADESLAKHKALELEIERLLRAVGNQDIMSVMQNNSIGDTSNLQTELEHTKERFKNCIIKKENEYDKLWNDWYKKCEECKYDKILYDKAYNDMQQRSNGCKLSWEISRDTTRGTSANTKFAKQSILGKPPSSSKTKLYAVTPIPKSMIFTKVGVDNTTKTKRPQSRSNTKNDRVPSASKSSCSKNKEVEVEEHLRNLLLSKNNKHMSFECYPNLFMVHRVRVYFVEGLGHNLFSVGQFCDSDLEVAFRRNTCFVRNLEEVDLLKGNCKTNLYTINLHEMDFASPICLMARATSTKSWLWHQHLSHLNFDTINDLAENDLVTGLLKLKYHKEHLCPSCEQGESKRASHPPKPVLNSRQRLHLLHMDLCGPMRIASINEKRNQMLVETTRTILIFSRAPLFLWAEAIATACFTQNRSIIHCRFNKTPYELINGKKPDISFLRVFGALCYPKNDREDIRKLGAKGDIGFFICYSADSCAYRVYNQKTKKIIETVNVTFDELSAMAFNQTSSKPGLQSMTSEQISSGLDLTYAPSTITTQQPTEGELDLLFEAMYDDYIGGQPSAALRTILAAQAPQVHQTSLTSTSIANTTPTPTN
uniref:Gag-Pol polyprotein n=1 Tax=Tanacetum cinerariifolium TaxID=118510 RepID=A0A6L2L7A5_TANCI|nr:Gag-Pol polyprotein [Tanacetum cinerariifolium]